jgi:hypothetical protein
MTRRLRLRELGLVLTIFAVLGAGILASACGTMPAPAKTKRATCGSGYDTDPMGVRRPART